MSLSIFYNKKINNFSYSRELWATDTGWNDDWFFWIGFEYRVTTMICVRRNTTHTGHWTLDISTTKNNIIQIYSIFTWVTLLPLAHTTSLHSKDKYMVKSAYGRTISLINNGYDIVIGTIVSHCFGCLWKTIDFNWKIFEMMPIHW